MIRRSHNLKNRRPSSISGAPAVLVCFLVFYAFVFTCFFAPPAYAADIPFQRLLLGSQSQSILDDAAVYPPCYVSLLTDYWDVYHEHRGSSLHNYDQIDTRIKTVHQRGPRMFGLEVRQSLLTLEQQNVYTDADMLDGARDVLSGKILLGYFPAWNVYPLGLRGFSVAGSAGWAEGPAGEIEGELLWPRVCLRVRAETAGNLIKFEQTIGGFRFPFHFPFRVDRVSGRVALTLPRASRLSLWGGVETCHGEGKEVKGFANRLWNRRYSFGCSFGHGLREAHPLRRVPRLEENRRLPGLRLSITHHNGDGDVGMYLDGTRYLHLEDLRSFNTAVRFDLVPYKNVSVFGGWERIRIKHNGDTFVDIWPFTVWDVFLAKRYRLDQLDVHLDTSFLGLGGVIERGRFELESSARFEWWRDGGVFDWLERVGAPYLFIFKYERHTVTTYLSPEYAVQLDLALKFRAASNTCFRLSGRGMVPFSGDTEDSSGGTPGPGGGPATTAEENHQVHGGLLGSLELIKEF